jgi:hypothetical protein
MNYIELYINNQQVELDDSFGVRLNRELYDDVNMKDVDINYSFTIKIPTTLKNKQIFNFIEVEEVPNKFNHTYTAQLYVNSTLLMDGNYINNEVDQDYYYGNLYTNTQKALKDIFGDLSLDKTKVVNGYITNFTNFNSQNLAVLNNFNNPSHAAYICYPYLLYNLPYNKPSYTTNRYYQYNRNTETYTYLFFFERIRALGGAWNYDNILPAFNVISLIKNIFSTFNYNLEGNILSDSRFTKLFQTIQIDKSKLDEVMQIPYYIKFNHKFTSRDLTNNTTATYIQKGGKDNMSCAAADLLINDNVNITNLDDRFNLMNSGYIRIPKSGWYKFNCQGSVEYNTQTNALWEETNKDNITGIQNNCGYGGFDANPFEFQILKGKSPTDIEAPEMVGVYGFNPSQPLGDFGLGTWNEENKELDKTYMIVDHGLGIQYANETYFPANERTLLINDSSNPNTENFIAGARYGCFNFYEPHTIHIPPAFTFNIHTKNYPGGGLYNNPDPSKTSQSPLQGNNDLYYFQHEIKSMCYPRQANCMVKTEGKELKTFASCSGYKKLNLSYNPTTDKHTKTWSDTDKYKIQYNGLAESSIGTSSISRGTFDIHDVVWFEEGEYISFWSIQPYIKLQRYDTTTILNAVVLTTINTTFEMAYINNNENWNYKNETVSTLSFLKMDRLININSLLPQVKVNDYLNNFINTFNLKLTRVDENTYAINTSNNNHETGEIINLEPYIDISRNKYSRLSTNGEYTFNFSIDQEEEGYIHKGTNNVPSILNYTGGTSYINKSITNGSISKVDSLFSYNWYKNITLIDQKEKTSKTIQVPVITDNKIWDENMSIAEAQDEGLYTDKTMRLFYVKNDNSLKIYPVDMNPSQEVLLIQTTNQSPDGTLELTFDKNNPRSITNQFFNIKESYGHQVQTKLYLPANLYPKLTKSNKVKMNNDIYSIVSITGFDPTENEITTLKLIKE